MKHSCTSYGFAAVVNFKFAIDTLQVTLDGVDRNIQCLGDFLVGVTLSQQLQYLGFPLAYHLYQRGSNPVAGGGI